MKYSTVEITPKSFEEVGWWKVHYYDIPYEREEVSIQPSTLGYFYYPTEWGVQKGFEILKQRMIDWHKSEIETLQNSLDALKKLKLEEEPT